ncbi:MAG: acyl-CoA dehydrogenase family protein [bacterium]|nr:MAG: acyl-CoA dehydrogenase family protein [bacterium]
MKGHEGKPIGEKGSTKGFLEELYLDVFNRGRFGALTFPGRDPKAEEIIAEYRKLIKDYSPARLEEEGTIPDELMDGLKKLGLFGLNVPAGLGGVGLSLTGYLSVLESMARTDMALALTPTAHLSIGIKGIILFGTEEQKRKYLTKAASGEMIFAYALTEPKVGSDARHITTSVTLSEDGRHYILNGQKTYITNGGFAGGLTAFAQMDPERPGFMGAFIVETAWNGVQIGNEIPKMGIKASSTTPITFTDVRVPAENLLGKPGDGFRIAMTVLNYGRLGLGAASKGAMDQSLDDMFQRASSRVQFGVPIRDFELVQEMMVRAAAHSLAAEAMTAATAGLLEADPTGPMAIESSHVKLYGTTRAWDTLYDALQTAGGSGYLSSSPYEKRMRDFRVTTVFEGTSEIHSIYPALFLLRNLGKRIRGMGRLRQAIYLLRGAYGSPGLSPAYSEPGMKRAAGLAGRLARGVRKMVHLGLMKYGRDVVGHEFFLRRVSRLSLALYGLLASLALIDARKKDGEDISTDLNRLRYLTEEAARTLRDDLRIRNNGLESAGRRVFTDLVSARETGHREPNEGGGSR